MVGRNSLPMSVNSRMTSTMITQTIEMTTMAVSNALTWVCIGGNSIWRSRSSMALAPRLVDLDRARTAQPQAVTVKTPVLRVDPEDQHGDGDDDPDPGQYVVGRRRARAALAVGRARAERHDPGAVLVGLLEDEVGRVVRRLRAADRGDAVRRAVNDGRHVAPPDGSAGAVRARPSASTRRRRRA